MLITSVHKTTSPSFSVSFWFTKQQHHHSLCYFGSQNNNIIILLCIILSLCIHACMCSRSSDHQATSTVCIPLIAKPQVQCAFLWSPSHKCSVCFSDRQATSAVCVPVITKPQVQCVFLLCAFLWLPSHKCSVRSCDCQATSAVCILWSPSHKSSVRSCDCQATRTLCTPLITKPQVQCALTQHNPTPWCFLNPQHPEDVPLVEFTYLVFTRMPGESYRSDSGTAAVLVLSILSAN